jgi:hypothetical protein
MELLDFFLVQIEFYVPLSGRVRNNDVLQFFNFLFTYYPSLTTLLAFNVLAKGCGLLPEKHKCKITIYAPMIYTARE